MGRAVVLLLALAVVVPFLYMVAGARFAAHLPAELGLWLASSLVVAILAAASQVVTSAAAAYAFARLRFPAREVLFRGLIALLLIPGVLVLFPRLAVVTALGGADRYAGLISPGLVSAWGILLLYRTFRRLPTDVEDAARLDGAGDWTVLWRVVAPSAAPALTLVAGLAFVGQWSSLAWPLLVAPAGATTVAELGLAGLARAAPGAWTVMAVAVIASLPPLAVVLVARRAALTALRRAL
jgi:ABC-type glycerol-3-phosphate transport system permease component